MSKKWSLSWTDTGIICIIIILLAGFYANIYAPVEIITALERQEATATAVSALTLEFEGKISDAEDAWGAMMGSSTRAAYGDGYSEGYADALNLLIAEATWPQLNDTGRYEP